MAEKRMFERRIVAEERQCVFMGQTAREEPRLGARRYLFFASPEGKHRIAGGPFGTRGTYVPYDRRAHGPWPGDTDG